MVFLYVPLLTRKVYKVMQRRGLEKLLDALAFNSCVYERLCKTLKRALSSYSPYVTRNTLHNIYLVTQKKIG